MDEVQSEEQKLTAEVGRVGEIVFNREYDIGELDVDVDEVVVGAVMAVVVEEDVMVLDVR